MLSFSPKEIPLTRLHHYLQGSIAPRPIAFASTIDEEGIPNLSPFSFFNVFGTNPTTLVFSPSRRGRDNTTKHTYENIKKIPEVVINVVTRDIVEQTSLSSTEYPEDVNEFVKAGLTMLESEKIRPFRVKESPVQFECKVRDVIETGSEGGAGNLVICEILVMHIDESILDEDDKIDPNKIKLVGRLGGDFYSKTYGDAIFKVEKPLQKLGIGIDALPEKIRLSSDLSGNELGKLGNIERLPDVIEVESFRVSDDFKSLFTSNKPDHKELLDCAKGLLENGDPEKALKLLLLI